MILVRHFILDGFCNYDLFLDYMNCNLHWLGLQNGTRKKRQEKAPGKGDRKKRQEKVPGKGAQNPTKTF